MLIKKAELYKVIGPTSRLPDNDLPEIAFAGRSNVGKSSLINALAGRKALARTSGQPGKTRTINFYNINDTFYLTDLPGYGFAKAPKSEIEAWGQLIEKYLSGSKSLKAVFLLTDIRHDPPKNDLMMYRWVVENGFRPIIIATKADKIKRSRLAAQIKAVGQGFGLSPDDVLIPFSAVTKQGREEILETIEKIAGV